MIGISRMDSKSFTNRLIFLFLLISSNTIISHGQVVLPSAESPGFTTSNAKRLDYGGYFLASPSGAFRAGILIWQSLGSTSCHFIVRHLATGQVIWSANRDSPISTNGQLSLTEEGLTIADGGEALWSTPPLLAPVKQMCLLNSGNLVLLDKFNKSLWQSFQYPTDTIITGQKLFINQSLISAVSSTNLSTGNYQFSLTISGDAVAQWGGSTYWMLTMENNAFMVSNVLASYMAMNGSGLYIFGENGSDVVVQMVFSSRAKVRFARLKSNGQFEVETFKRDQYLVQEFEGPADICQIPFTCGKLGVCWNATTCSCPQGFTSDSQNSYSCIPFNNSYSLPSQCKSSSTKSELKSSISYIKLPDQVDYFTNSFTEPELTSVNLTACKDFCTQNCSCLGIFYGNSSSSCYILKNYLGSLIPNYFWSNDYRIGYIKAQVVLTDTKSKRRSFPFVALISLPLFGLFLLIVLVVFLVRTKMWSSKNIDKLGSRSFLSDECDFISMLGLPVKFEYRDLAEATENFSTEIGSGGFGTVYKGTVLNDIVAVKKINSIGAQGRREFYTEISIIGNIHHLNLVKLLGFCIENGKRFLVYEYMNKGSLDSLLFGDGPILEWDERFKIALGAARGLAYLHSGCEHKIIHCDVKPENIHLHENLEIKISDFGISKLLRQDESGHHTAMRGTLGYMAPEWLHNFAMSDKLDVYSYGMVLLEIVRGRRNWSPLKSHSSSSRQSHLVSGADLRSAYFPLLALELHMEGKYLELVDPRLEGKANMSEVEKLIRVALCCVHRDPQLRPSMSHVARMLEGTITLCEPRLESLKFLQWYGRRYREEERNQQNNEQNIVELRQGDIETYSYMSSQQISGPR